LDAVNFSNGFLSALNAPQEEAPKIEEVK